MSMKGPLRSWIGLLLAVAVIGITGCGLGDRRFQAPADATPEEAVLLRDRALSNYIINEDLSNVIQIYSDLYQSPVGGTKASVRQGYENLFRTTDVIRIDVLQEEFMGLNPDQTRLTQNIVQQWIGKNKATNEQTIEHVSETREWIKESGIWRIFSSQVFTPES